MKLTITLVIEFVLVVQSALILFIMLLNKIKLTQKANFTLLASIFQKSQHYVKFLFFNPSTQRLVDERYSCG
ncbi:hypothetical protein J2X17_001277 [Flavobacterium aquidurense]|nr:hypothetical protein [Flavobacterium aquidurense]